jgi:short subunit dehydrogenase-like uncharacterized protein
MNSPKNKLMIYGANGYSAKLILKELIENKIKPLLAGRNEQAIVHLARQYNCDYRIFDTNSNDKITAALNDVHTLLNCAGPFKYTAKELIEACIQTKTNYIDITGEIPVLHLAFSSAEKAKGAGITILPGAGFDVIPSDCLAKRLSEQMPDATHLKLGMLNIKGKISRGTFLTTLDFLGSNGIVRRNGEIIESQIGEYSIKVKRNGFLFNGISIPWGDIYTSYKSTGIPNIEVYLGLSPSLFFLRHVLLPVLKLFKIGFVEKLISSFIKKSVTGPNEEQRNATKTFIWGRVENVKGEIIEGAYQFMEGYNLTAKGAAEVAKRILNNQVPPGTYTPSLAFGSSFMDQFVIKKIF